MPGATRRLGPHGPQAFPELVVQRPVAQLGAAATQPDDVYFVTRMGSGPTITVPAVMSFAVAFRSV